jgi:hydrogenase-4 component B
VKPVSLFSEVPAPAVTFELARLMQHISLSVWGLVVLILVIYLIRKWVTRYAASSINTTWGGGYAANTNMQYTASSFVRSYTKLIKPLVVMKKSKDEVGDIIPLPMHSETHFHDKIEIGLIDWFVRNLKGFLGRFKFLQNGSVQFYVLYGVVFIGISIAIPVFLNAIQYLAKILKQL